MNLARSLRPRRPPRPRRSQRPSSAAVETVRQRADAIHQGQARASVLASDLTITGNIKTTGDVVVEGIVDGDIRAHLLTVGETATIRGEIVADDIVINGRVIGRVRG